MVFPAQPAKPDIPLRSSAEADFDAKMVQLFLWARDDFFGFVDAWATWLTQNSTVIGDELNNTAIGLTVPAPGKFTALEADSLGGDALVGTVAQVGGVPTGAVIERGSNANGEYVRFADGTQICWFSTDLGDPTAFGAGTFSDPYRSDAFAQTFPAAFVSAPKVLVVPAIDTPSRVSRVMLASFRNADASSITGMQAARATGDTDTTPVSVEGVAVGRWF